MIHRFKKLRFIDYIAIAQVFLKLSIICMDLAQKDLSCRSLGTSLLMFLLPYSRQRGGEKIQKGGGWGTNYKNHPNSGVF